MAVSAKMKIFKQLKIDLEKNNPKPTVVQVYHFINPFHPKYQHLKFEKKRLYVVREKILRLFKTPKTKKKVILDHMKSQKILRSATPGSLPSLGNDHLNDEELFFNVPASIKSILPWLLQPLSKKDRNETMSKFDFKRIMISIMLIVIKEFGFNYKILKSRNEEEMFVKVIASENALCSHAKNMDYQLRFIRNLSWNREFQRTPPYGPIWLMGQNDNFFARYNENSEISLGGSLFTFIDKYTIVNKVLTEKMNISVLKDLGLLIENFIPHEPAPRQLLMKEWASFSKIMAVQPIEKIRTYFSEYISFYFCWLDTYKIFMVYCGLVGTVIFIIERIARYFKHDSIALISEITFCVFLSIWAVIFEQYWTRKEKRLSWEWGTIELVEKQIQRENFQGVYIRDEATGKMKMIRASKLKHHSVKFLSYSTVLLFVSLVIVVVITVFQFRITLMNDYEWKDYGAIISAIAYAIQINIFDLIYTYLAKVLTNWENRETIEIYNNAFAFKLFLFRFVNSYSGLFYIAFFKEYYELKCGFEGCLNELGFQLTVIFITNIILNIIELGLPWFLAYFREIREKMSFDHKKIGSQIRPNLYEVEKEAQKEPYDYAIEDYMEMCLQYGFVALFGASFPMIGALACLEIHLEIRVDANKLCNFVRRPEPLKVKNIGIWKKIILIISIMGVLTNSGIILITSKLFEHIGWNEKIEIFLILEHVLLSIILLIRFAIPDTPSVVIKWKKWSNRLIREIMAGSYGKEKREPEFRSQDSSKSHFYLSEQNIKK